MHDQNDMLRSERQVVEGRSSLPSLEASRRSQEVLLADAITVFCTLDNSSRDLDVATRDNNTSTV